ncbi:MAG TPA: HD domain-containing phosphohydrolase [Candidatus Elarobacter sp.]|jgi:HD-GYP domain-containing protein (c-di-GMP phosphodiesterase class II)|nr:HD domain-containing phosphohydrolase [Candidatus Elarobacter sp.]
MLVDPVLSEVFAQPFTAAFLGAVLAHDYETHRHLLNVGMLSARIAQTAGLSRDEAILLGQAGLFHDIGKLHIRRALLNAHHELSEAEWRILKAHAVRGEQMLHAQGSPALASIVRGHHERLDGSGYPDGLRGAQIPWETRLLSVVDAYDAMRSGRPYAAAVAHDEALERLILADHLFDADAVSALVATLGATHAEKHAPRKALAPLS